MERVGDVKSLHTIMVEAREVLTGVLPDGVECVLVLTRPVRGSLSDASTSCTSGLTEPQTATLLRQAAMTYEADTGVLS